MQIKRIILTVLLLLTCSLTLMSCSSEAWGVIGTALAPVAETSIQKGGDLAATKSQSLEDTLEARLITEAAELMATAKVGAATKAAELFETAKAGLATEFVRQATLAPTTLPQVRDTALARIATEAALRIPQAQTQAAILQPTLEAGFATEAVVSLTRVASLNQTAQAGATPMVMSTPLVLTQAASMAQTAQAGFATQAASPITTPVPPVISQPPAGKVVTYTVLLGDDLQTIAERFSVPIQYLLIFNQLRYPELKIGAGGVQPGWVLIMAADPLELLLPRSGTAWSNTPGCDVSGVTWLDAPVACGPGTVDVISNVTQRGECVSTENPLGSSLEITRYQGWMLTGAGNILNYGWFYDPVRQAVVVGPAIVTQMSTYQGCGQP